MTGGRVIPLSEYRKAGFQLFYDHTPAAGLFTAALMGALLLVLGVAVLLTFVVLISELFGAGVEQTGFATLWLTLPLRSSDSIINIVFLPFRILPGLWRFDLFISILFVVAAYPARKAFFLSLYKDRGQKSGNILTRNSPLFIFSGGFLLLWLFLYMDKPGLMVITHQPLMTVTALLMGVFLLALLLQVLWEWAYFQGFLMYHTFFLHHDPERVTKQRILNLFEDKDSII